MLHCEFNTLKNNVLVVDDFDSVRNFVVCLLSGQGYEATGAGDAVEALEMLSTRHFDLLVTDIRMPGMNGFALSRASREMSPDTHVVLMTGAPEVGTDEWADACGRPANARYPVDGIWMKPLDAQAVIASVRSLVPI